MYQARIQSFDRFIDMKSFIFRHTYVLKSDVAFTGHSYFGGQDNELILCAGKSESFFLTVHIYYANELKSIFTAGDICIWDTESGALLHHIRAPPHGGDLTCIAWSHAATNPFIFASGNHDGTVRIWSKPTNSPVDKSPMSSNLDDLNWLMKNEMASTSRQL